MLDSIDLDEKLLKPSANSDQEHQLIKELRGCLKGQPELINSLLKNFPDFDDYLQIRLVRSLKESVPPENHTIQDFLVSDNSTYLYFLLKSLEQPLSRQSFAAIKSLADHEKPWVAAECLSVMARSHHHNPDPLIESLCSEDRNTVLIRLLKTLYKERINDFSESVYEIAKNSDWPQVQFYAVVLLKATDREYFQKLPDSNRYNSRNLAKIDVIPFDREDKAD